MANTARADSRRSINFWVHALAGSLSKGAMRYYSARFGIGLPEMRVLHTLAQDGNLAARNLVALTAMDKALVSRVLSSLEKNGYVTPAGDGDRVRLRKWALTTKGREMIRTLEPEWTARWEFMLADISLDERDHLKRVLETIFHASEELGRLEDDENRRRAGERRRSRADR